MRVSTIFLGTPEVAAQCLEVVRKLPFIDIKRVITMPDRKQGRKQILTPTPLAEAAKKAGIEVSYAHDSKSLSSVLRDIDFDLGIVVAYGVLISKKDLEIPQFGFVNLHFSLLPRYRGASPVQSALLNGDPQTGACLFKLVPRMDAGPIIGQTSCSIDTDDTADRVFDKLIESSKPLFNSDLQKYLGGSAPYPQCEDRATYCSKMTRKSGRVNWEWTAEKLYNAWRAYTPWPGIYTTINDKRLKLLSVRPTDEIFKNKAGSLIEENGKLYIKMKGSSAEILELQLEGKKPMTAAEFIRGNKTLLTMTCI